MSTSYFYVNLIINWRFVLWKLDFCFIQQTRRILTSATSQLFQVLLKEQKRFKPLKLRGVHRYVQLQSHTLQMYCPNIFMGIINK